MTTNHKIPAWRNASCNRWARQNWMSWMFSFRRLTLAKMSFERVGLLWVSATGRVCLKRRITLGSTMSDVPAFESGPSWVFSFCEVHNNTRSCTEEPRLIAWAVLNFDLLNYHCSRSSLISKYLISETVTLINEVRDGQTRCISKA